jgi:hypothetical protein
MRTSDIEQARIGARTVGAVGAIPSCIVHTWSPMHTNMFTDTSSTVATTLLHGRIERDGHSERKVLIHTGDITAITREG